MNTFVAQVSQESNRLEIMASILLRKASREVNKCLSPAGILLINNLTTSSG